MGINEFTKQEKALIRMAANRLNERKHDSDKGWDEVCNQLLEKEKKSGSIIFFRYIVVIAVVFLSVFAVWLYSERHPRQMAETHQIAPMAGKPELILASGKRVLLDSFNASHMVEQPGAVVVFDTSTHSLNYRESKTGESEVLLAYNQLCVPKGGEYSLTLSDGTRVWMNAESSLRYPVKFGPGTREVYLEGEAYFEVAPDKESPFIVHMGQKTVNVLGTVFNVSAYPSDSYWHVTLASGKVRVNSEEESFLLSPGHQYLENVRTGEKEMREVVVDQYLSWRTGKIIFRGERLEDIIQKLERWFEFRIFYVNEEVREMRFRGAISKYDSFDTVLRKLEKTTDIRFEIKGNTVIVSKIYQN